MKTKGFIFRSAVNSVILVLFVLMTALSFSSAETLLIDDGEQECIEPLKGVDLSAFRQPTNRWQFVGDASLDPQDDRGIATKPGAGVLVGRGGIPNIFTSLEHGDVEAHIEFMVPKGSNSGVYFMGRYEIQVFDSWGVEKPQHSDCGGIYQRWDPGREGGPGFDGIPPRVNASKRPGEWQSYDVIFKAPRFDSSGKKIANAKFVKVVHNGILIHENQEATGPTRAAAFGDEKKVGPLMFQGDHGPVAYRNIRIRPLAGAPIAGAGYISDELINSLREYDFGKSRNALVAIEDEIRNASPARKQVIEGKLLEVLKSGRATYAARQFVCRILRQTGTEESVPVLAKFLTDEKLSHMARFALQQMPYGEVDRVLLGALDKAGDKTKIGIISSIAQRGDKGAVEKIAEYISSDNEELAKVAISALGWIGGEKAAEILMKAKVPSTLELAKDDALVSSADRMLSGGQAEKALAVYEKMTGEDKDVMVRIAAYSGIVKANKDKAVGMVLSLLEDENKEVRNAAARFVAEMEGVEATRTFAEKIPSLGIDSQVMLINCLANRGDTAAAIDVAKAVKSDNKSVRTTAVSALGEIGTASQVKLLVEQAMSEEDDMAKAAKESLAKISGGGVSDEIIKVAKLSSPDVRANIIELLIDRNQSSALPFLLDAVKDKNSNVRSAAYNALASLAGKEQVGDIVELLLTNKDSGEREQIRRALVSVIKRLENLKEVSDTIIECITKAEDDGVRVSLLPVLNQIGGERALEIARNYLASRNSEIKKAAIRTLSDWPEPAPMKNLLDIAASDSIETNRILALRGYIKLSSLPSERFNSQTVEMLKRAFALAGRAEEKKSVLFVLPNFPCKEALELAKKSMDDESTAAEAGVAVKKLQAMSLIATGSKVTTSGGTNVHMINDRIIPKSHEDGMVSFHWWPRNGTEEWVQYDFGGPEQVSTVVVYWFDDTGRGACRVPKTWKVLYRKAGRWEPVKNTNGYGVERDKFNSVTFESVKTDALRLQIQLQDNWSGGIHEWRVE